MPQIQPNNVVQCPQAVQGRKPMAITDPCLGSGGGTTPLSASYKLVHGYSYSTQASDGSLSATGYGTDLNGVNEGTATAYTATSLSDTLNHYVVTMPQYSSGTATVAVPAGRFIVAGNNALPNGGNLYVDTTSGTATATETISGVTYTITGSMESDGHTVDVTYTGTDGTYVQDTMDANVYAPTEMASITTASRHAMSVAGKIGAVATVVAASAATVMFVTALVPGGQGVSLAAGIIMTGATIIAAGAGLADQFQSGKK